jgi:hypothetical protein
MAVIVSLILYNVFSLSGWKDNHLYLPIIRSNTWTTGVIKLAASIDTQLSKHSLDKKYNKGKNDKFYTLYIKIKLLALYIDFYIKY